MIPLFDSSPNIIIIISSKATHRREGKRAVAGGLAAPGSDGAAAKASPAERGQPHPA